MPFFFFRCRFNFCPTWAEVPFGLSPNHDTNFVIIRMPYGNYGQENLFRLPIPFFGRFTMLLRVFQAVCLSYTLANRRLVSCLASYTLFQVLHGLQRGYRHPVRYSHTLLYRFGIFFEGIASVAGSIYPCLSSCPPDKNSFLR